LSGAAQEDSAAAAAQTISRVEDRIRPLVTDGF
jgi:hypothetical protein